MSWDSSRISAAIPSGVGFLGAGLIFKQAEQDEKGGISHVVHGLTTASAVWVAAAVGVACGGEMYVPASFCVGVMVVLLRFGPRQNLGTEEDEEDEQQDDEETAKYSSFVASRRAENEQSKLLPPPGSPTSFTSSQRKKMRNRSNFNTDV